MDIILYEFGIAGVLLAHLNLQNTFFEGRIFLEPNKKNAIYRYYLIIIYIYTTARGTWLKITE
jgi:hypothetical protein